MRVLLLEDDTHLLMAYADALTDDGHVVEACRTEDEAMRQLLHHGSAIDVMVLDLCIGSGTSLSIADYAGYAAPQAEVIVVTGSDLFPNGELHGLSRSIKWALRKPVRMLDLQSMIKFAIHRKENQSHLKPGGDSH